MVSVGNAGAEAEDPSLRVVIVDDNTLFLHAARDFLQREGLTVLGIASSGRDAVDVVRELRPDVVLVDVDLGDESGFAIAQELAQVDDMHIVVISAYPAADFVELVAASPAIGFVAKAQLSASAISELIRDAEH